ncbi:MAG: hypothetical protein M3004_00570 [Bacteroidota bacterium]|nr:hypothetical protein [Bacteroidota bacterium]
MNRIAVFLLGILLYFNSFSQGIGTKVSFKGTDGKLYTATISNIQGDKYKLKYDGFDFEAWATSDQFTVTNNPAYQQQNTNRNSTQNLIGAKVSFTAVDGKTYTGIIKEINGSNYKIKYDGFDFESWLVNNQFTILNNNNTGTTVTNPPVYQQKIKTSATTVNAGAQDVISIFDFGKRQGWVSVVQENKLNTYLGGLSQQDKTKLVQFINQAKTNSAKFFVLKSLLAGDNFNLLQNFINQLNQYPESYQQEKCLVYTRHSIIQQWQQTCSVTTVQTFLGDLCPRYAWDVKKVNNFDVPANDPSNAMAQQQKDLLEKYGGSVSARGSYSGKEIGILEPLNDFVGRILGVNFTFEEITGQLPTAFIKIRTQLDRGIDVPLNIKFIGSEARHFILMMKYTNTASGYQYLIYDPWDGVCDYVSESNLLQGSLAPLNNQWKISVDYYYPAL